LANPEKVSSGPARRRWRGWLWKIAAVLVASGFPLVLIVAGLAGESLPLEWQIPVAIVLATIAAGLILVARRYYRTGSRHLVLGGAEVVARDERKPILYLRSFAEEQRVQAEEEALARVMNEAGPFVAIGKPGEELPPLGASRFYARDFESVGTSWQGLITTLLGGATLTFVAPGATPGLGWELSECRRVLSPDRLAILVPTRKSLYDAFLQHFGAATQIVLPSFPERASKGFKEDTIIGLVRFDKRWNPYLIMFLNVAARLDHVDHLDQREDRLRAGLIVALADLRLGFKGRLRRLRYWLWSIWTALLVLSIVAVVAWLWLR
jgi:hypothetical protein